MLPTTLRGESVFLLPYIANWANEKPSLTLAAKSAVTRSLAGIEDRGAYAHTLRATSFKCSLFLRRAEHDTFRAALRQLGNKRVLMPLWPFAHTLMGGRIIYTDHAGRVLIAPDSAIYGIVKRAATPPIQTGLWLTMERDLSHWEIHETDLSSTPRTFSDSALRVPLMLGVLSTLPEPRALTPNLLAVGIEFEDTAPAHFAPRAVGASLATPSVFPLRANWYAEVRAGGVTYDIEREAIGQGRTPATTYYPQPHARVLQATFSTFAVDELATLIAFFQNRQGTVESFTINHPHDGPIAARFAKNTLDLNFANGRVTHTRITLLEVPHEAEPPPGAVLGARPRHAQLFRFTYGLGSQKVVSRFTGYERDLAVAGEIYLARHIEHGDITESLEPEKTKVKITARAFDGNPLFLFSPPRLEGPLQVEILRCNPDTEGAAATAELRFIGRVGKPDLDGPVITCEAAHLLADLLSDIPDMLIQAECNYEFCSAPCGVSRAAWTFTAAVARYDGTVLTLENLARADGTLPLIGPNYFARGRVEFGDGATFQSRPITTSTALNAGTISLTPSQPFEHLPTGTIKLHPTCDGLPESCRLFGNYQRTGAFPFVPAGNPSLRVIKDEPTAGKK